MKKTDSRLSDQIENGEGEGAIQTSCLGVTRRTFVQGVGATLAAVTLPGALAGCDSSSDGTKPTPDELIPSSVAVVRAESIDEMVKKAIAMAGGLCDIAQGDTVFIKPNMVVPSDKLGNRVTTHPEVLRAVIKAVKERTAAENITVGDRSAFTYPTTYVAQKTGIDVLCTEEGVKFLPLESGTYVNFTHPSFKNFKGPIAIPEVLSTFKHFINVPTLKNHTKYTAGDIRADGLDFWLPKEEVADDYVVMYARFTMCMKSLVGLLPFDPENPDSHCRVNSGLHQQDIGQKVAEINLVVPKTTMNVIDGISALVENGPAGPNAVYVNSNLVIASKDRVACDSVGLAVLKYHAKKAGVTAENEPYIEESVWKSPQIVRAGELGIGKASPIGIAVVPAGVDEFADIMAEWIA